MLNVGECLPAIASWRIMRFVAAVVDPDLVAVRV